MKNISDYKADKYPKGGIAGLLKRSKYKCVEDGIYKTEDRGQTLYVTSLTFVQEPEYEEGENASMISQYPLEDILDKYLCHISDFYEDLNVENSQECFIEFASFDLGNIKELREIIGKHVYNKATTGEDGREYIKLIIE